MVFICKGYRGLRHEELNRKAGVIDAEFVHKDGFVGATKSFESAINIIGDSLHEYRNYP